MNDFVVLIPAHNEAKTIFSVASKAKKYLDNILIIDDGSTDNTWREAQKTGATILKHQKNLGKGAALKTGFDYILHHFPDVKAVITLDGDGQHSPDEIPKFIEALRKTGADLILGERIINRNQMPFLRRLGNRFFSWLISLKIGQKISDSQSGFRLLSRKLLEGSDLKSTGYGIETDILLETKRNKFKMATIPISVTYLNKKYKLVKDFKIIIAIFKKLF